MISDQLSARVIIRLASALDGKRTFDRRAHPHARHRNRRNRHLLTVISEFLRLVAGILGSVARPRLARTRVLDRTGLCFDVF